MTLVDWIRYVIAVPSAVVLGICLITLWVGLPLALIGLGRELWQQSEVK